MDQRYYTYEYPLNKNTPIPLPNLIGVIVSIIPRILSAVLKQTPSGCIKIMGLYR
jgi:hypothetical protein